MLTFEEFLERWPCSSLSIKRMLIILPTAFSTSKFLPKAKEILRKAQDELEEIMDQEEATEVFKICTYLYPLTVPKKH